MKKFRTYGEWRKVEFYGEDIVDAILRKGMLQRPDKFAGGKIAEEGATVFVKRIVGEEDITSSSRYKDHGARRIIVEDTLGKIWDVDVFEEKTTITDLDIVREGNMENVVDNYKGQMNFETARKKADELTQKTGKKHIVRRIIDYVDQFNGRDREHFSFDIVEMM